MIALAYVYSSVWTIVAGALLGSLLRVVLSHVMMPGPRMRFAWGKEHVKEIVTFGKWINLSSIATFAGSQGDVIILGLLLPSSVLGTYYVAKMLSDAIEFLLERVNASMTLPILSEVIRNNPDKLRNRYYRFRLPIELVAAGAAGFLFAAGELIVNILYDQRYAEAGVMLQILSFGLLIYPFQLIRSAFTAIGKTHIPAWVSVLQAVSLVTCLSLGYYIYGSLGAIAGIAINRIVPSVAMLVLAHRERWISWWCEARWVPIYVIGFALGKLATYLLGSTTILNIRHIFR
jgi:O-antigen/teichoic acid export membrane protein